MAFCIALRRVTSKLLELVPNPFDDINKIFSKQLMNAKAIKNNTYVNFQNICMSFMYYKFLKENLPQYAKKHRRKIKITIVPLTCYIFNLKIK